GAAAPAVVEQGVDCLLEHPLLVVDDDLGRAQVEEPLQPVVAVDDPAIQVVEVGGGEATTVQLDHRPDVRRDHRDGLEDHVLGVVLALPEGLHDLHPLGGTLALLLGRSVERLLKRLHLGVEVHPAEQVLDRLGAHAADEVLAVAVVDLPPKGLRLDASLGLEVLEGVEGLLDQLGLALRPLLAVADLPLDFLAAGVYLLRLGPAFLHPLELVLESLEAVVPPLLELLADDCQLVLHVLLELGKVLLALLLVDARDQVGGEVDDLLEVLGGHVEQVAEAAGHTLEEPDVGDRGGQLDVAHPLAAHLRARDFHATALADDALVADPLVLAAVALPVPLGTEDALVEQALLLRAEGAIVDRLGLLDLTVGPRPDL